MAYYRVTGTGAKQPGTDQVQLSAESNLLVYGYNSGSDQTISSPGAISPEAPVTLIEEGGAFTLANGSQGRRVILVRNGGTGDAVVTPVEFANGSTITFPAADNDTAELHYSTTMGWLWVGGTATVA